VSQALTLFTTPVIYVYLDRLARYFRPRPAAETASGADAPATRRSAAE
jgi:hypothetical protein